MISPFFELLFATLNYRNRDTATFNLVEQRASPLKMICKEALVSDFRGQSHGCLDFLLPNFPNEPIDNVVMEVNGLERHNRSGRNGGKGRHSHQQDDG